MHKWVSLWILSWSIVNDIYIWNSYALTVMCQQSPSCDSSPEPQTKSASSAICARPNLSTMADLIVAIKESRFSDVSRRLNQESKANLKVLVNYQDRESHESLLFCVCIKGHLRLAKFLLDRGARADLRTCWGAAPIHAASEKGHEEIIRYILLTI